MRNIVYLSNMAEALDGRTLEGKASCTRVSAENNIRRRFVGTKSNAGKTTEKLVGTWYRLVIHHARAHVYVEGTEL